MSSDDPKNRHLTLVKGKDLSNPIEVLEVLRDAILRKSSADREEAAKALRQVLKDYEQQNRVFLIASANAELPRIVRLLNFLSDCEEVMFTKERLESASTKELMRMYALAQSNLLSGLDNVKKIADMRLDALRAAGGADGVEKIFNIEKDDELNALAGLPALDSVGRDRVRKLVDGLVDSLDNDDSVTEDDDEESPTDNSND